MEIVCVRDDGPAMTPSTTDQSSSRLLSLPGELRNLIWCLLLVQQEDTRRVCAELLRTCKQINAEGTPILYGENLFAAHPSLLATLPSLRCSPRWPSSWSSARRVLRPVTSQRVALMIRRFHLHVRLDTDPRFTRQQVEASFAGVDELLVEVFQAMYGSCDFGVLRLFEGVRGVGRARVYGSVGDGKYAAWLAATMMLDPGAQPEPYVEMYVGGDAAWNSWMHGNR